MSPVAGGWGFAIRSSSPWGEAVLNTPSLFDSLRVNSSYQRTKLVNGAQQITIIGVVYVVTFIDYTEQRLRKIKTLLRHQGELATKVRYFGVKSTKVLLGADGHLIC